MWKVLLAQAWRVAVPPHRSNAVGIAKDPSLASVVAMPDLLKQATDAQGLTANPSPLIAAALMYLIVLLPAVRHSRDLSDDPKRDAVARTTRRDIQSLSGAGRRATSFEWQLMITHRKFARAEYLRARRFPRDHLRTTA